MHQRVLQSISSISQPLIQIPLCHRYLSSSDAWWDENAPRFPPGYQPCNAIQAERIPPIATQVQDMLIDRYCPAPLRQEIKLSDQNRDCLVRPYLRRRRVLADSCRPRPKAFFSLRNYPLHLDQMEELRISVAVIEHYARAMAEALAVMHWGAGVDGSDVEFVLAAPPGRASIRADNDSILGSHAVWILDFDLCRDMSMNGQGFNRRWRPSLRMTLSILARVRAVPFGMCSASNISCPARLQLVLSTWVSERCSQICSWTA